MDIQGYILKYPDIGMEQVNWILGYFRGGDIILEIFQIKEMKRQFNK